MIKYHHILAYVASQLWAIDGAKLQEIIALLAFRAAGHTYTPEEIKARIGDGGGSSSASSQGSVAIIPVRGVIAHRMGSMDDSSGGTSVERIGAMVDQVKSDPSVSTILYEYDTPGGTVTGINGLADKMFSLRGVKKQTAMVRGACCSAGYWLAATADEIVGEEDSQAGSIGVLWPPHEDLSEALAKEGIKITQVYEGKYKIEWNPFETPTPEAVDFKQAQAKASYDQFIKSVARSRGVTPAAVRDGYGEGRSLFAKEAKAAGMIDRIATMDETIGRLVGRKSASGMRAETVEQFATFGTQERRRLL